MKARRLMKNLLLRFVFTSIVMNRCLVVISLQPTAKSTDLMQYPLALKMMFNYDIQSNAMAILKAMYKETIPARSKQSNDDVDGWEKL